ncbi:MAG: hypothetical protein IKM43_01215 [Clostridia bacterium]|nr:hypothetical protein [Clostridia bacterium]
MEKLYNTARTIHDKIVKDMTKRLNNAEIKKVIDAGSGKVSASLLLKYFPNSMVDAIIFPGDNRKKNPLYNAISSDRLEIFEADVCQTTFRKHYDFCLVHCTLGEAHNFGNHFTDLFHHIMDINSKYYLFVDVLEDPCVHFRYLEQWLKEKGYKIIRKKKFRNPHPEHYPKVKYDKYKLEYDSKHFLAYLVARSENK